MKLGVFSLIVGLAGCPAGEGGTELLSLESAELPRGTVGDPYEVRLVARGGVPPYRFSLASGAPPSGLSLATDGTVFGTPTAEGDYPFDVNVDDARSGRARGSSGITIAPRDPEPPAPLALETSELPPAGLGLPYDATLRASGGSRPYAWSILSGALPDGLEIDADGRIGGTATEAGISEAQIAVTDSAGAARWRSLGIAVVPPPTIDTLVLPLAVVGRPYSAGVTFSGGSSPASIEVWSGELPEGLAMDAAGAISGTPVAAETRTVRLRVTDGIGQSADRRIRLWTVVDEPYESRDVDEPVPPNCGELEARSVTAEVAIPDSGMLSRVQLVLDIDYENVGMLDVALVAPSGHRVPVHVGGSRVGGARSLHFLYERDKVSWGSFLPLVGQNPQGNWRVEVTVLPDPGFGCVEQAGLLERVAVVVGLETSSEDYLRVSGYYPNNLIDGPFARIAGGGLDQHAFDLQVERWSTGDDGIAEGGGGDDVLLAAPELSWTTDLPAGVGTLDPSGHFEAGESTGQGTIRGDVEGKEIVLPVDVVPPDWVP